MNRVLTGPRFVLEALRGRQAPELRKIYVERHGRVSASMGWAQAASGWFGENGPLTGVGQYKPPAGLGGDFKGAAVGTSPAYSFGTTVALDGDRFLVASPEQRLFYAGFLAALGRVHPRRVADDPGLDDLLLEVPFGCAPAEASTEPLTSCP